MTDRSQLVVMENERKACWMINQRDQPEKHFWIHFAISITMASHRTTNFIHRLEALTESQSLRTSPCEPVRENQTIGTRTWELDRKNQWLKTFFLTSASNPKSKRWLLRAYCSWPMGKDQLWVFDMSCRHLWCEFHDLTTKQFSCFWRYRNQSRMHRITWNKR